MSAPARRADVEPATRSSKRPRGPRALELVAMRGRDVVGVRHVRDGDRAFVGEGADALARLPTRDLREMGSRALLVGDARGGTFALHVPPRARARHHGGDGVPRILVGPQRFELCDGERAVLVLGAVQIRAQIVSLDPPRERGSLGVTLGLGLTAAAVVYAAALALAAAFAEPAPPRLEPGAMHRIHGRFLPESGQR